uniref:BHLH domain-containing protein n=1 Tax=Caenorhabditis tropicalis TaxID=1561998 RepID=A0A1I7V2F5_9PELO
MRPPAIKNRKQEKEFWRRDEINTRLRELELLIQTDSDDGRMTHEEILSRALTVATQIKRQSSASPFLRGVFKGFDRIESLVVSYIRSIEWKAKENRIKNFKECLKVSLLSKDSSSGTPSTPISTKSDPLEEPREAKRKREQRRRDRQHNALEALNGFIVENSLVEKGNKQTKLQVLQIIIDYIAEGIEKRYSVTSEEESEFKKGEDQGQTLAKGIAVLFFKNDPQLSTCQIALELYLQLHLNPIPLLGFPLLFNCLQNPPVSPSGSIGSPSSLSSTSSIRDENVSPVQEPKLFRPYI